MRFDTRISVDSPVRQNVLHALRDLARQANSVAWGFTGVSRKRVLSLKHEAYSALNSATAGGTSLVENRPLLALSRFACQANGVAHHLPEADQGPVFALKATALSVLILCKAAVLNGVVDDTAGIDLLLLPGKRLHCKLHRLQPDARELANQQAAFVPVCSPMVERVSPSALAGIQRLVRRAA